ncbi:MAG: zinc ribbon domain-containing protein [Anaerolineales bacterium]
MPVYSFICEECGVRFARQLSYQDYGTTSINCPKCGSYQVRRRINRVRMLREEGGDIGTPDDPDDLAKDPRAMARMMREMSSDMGEELGPEFDEVVDRLDEGQTPEDIERELPDLGIGETGTAD